MKLFFVTLDLARSRLAKRRHHVRDSLCARTSSLSSSWMKVMVKPRMKDEGKSMSVLVSAGMKVRVRMGICVESQARAKVG